MSHDLFDLTGKIALITGSSGGLGLVLARGLGKAGARIILNGRNSSKLDQAVAQLSKQNITVSGNAFDVTKSREITQQVEKIEEDIGPIDILINNAGIQHRGDLAEIEEDDWRSVIETNLTAPFLVSKQIVKSMIRNKAGKIINICSLMSEASRVTTGPYASSKGGLKLLTKAMAVDWAKHNIQINAIGPGYFQTEMTQVLMDNPKFDAWLKTRNPAGRWGKPDELIGAAVFLASKASDFVNGQIIYVDGGLLASV